MMSGIRGTNTKPEMRVRQLLHHRGFRFRLHDKSLPGKPDIVFGKNRLAVFCDGDFWHGRDLSNRLAKLRKGHNPEYWVKKVLKNVERDQRQTKLLESLGWTVVRFWETDIHRQVGDIADQIATTLEARTAVRQFPGVLSSSTGMSDGSTTENSSTGRSDVSTPEL